MTEHRPPRPLPSKPFPRGGFSNADWITLAATLIIATAVTIALVLVLP